MQKGKGLKFRRPLDFVSYYGKLDLMQLASEVDWEKAGKIFQKDKETIFGLLKKEVDRYPYSREILSILAAGTLLSAAVIMPNAGKMLAPSVWQGSGYKKKRFTQALKRLHKQKAVEIVETKEGAVVRITKNGFTKAMKYKMDEMRIQKQKRWDKKWRIVIFDIPEGKRKIRDEFRSRLKQIGFYPLQESVFVHAYPSFNEVEFLRQIYGVDIDVTYIIATKIEGQDNLRSIFKVG